MANVEKKNDEQKQGGNPSVVDAFISALFASAPATSPIETIPANSSSTSPTINVNPHPRSIDNEKANSEATLVKIPISIGANARETNIDEEYNPAVRFSTSTTPSGYSEAFSPSSSTTAPMTRTANKRERSLTEEVEAYSQLSKKKVAQPTTTPSDNNKRFIEGDIERRGYERGSRETGNMSPAGRGSDRIAYDHQHPRYQNQQNQRNQQQQHQLYGSYSQSAPSSSSYRGKAEIVPYHLQAQRGQPASSTYILALKPVDWSTAVAESRMLIRDVPTHMDNWDLLDHFASYGEIIEVVIKNQLGFVHFADAAACQSAVLNENGKFIKDFKLRLEVCKQKPHFARSSRAAATKTIIPSKSIQHHTPATSTHVHLLVWNHVPATYVQHVSQSFEYASLPTQISYLANRSASNQEQIIREKVDIGAIAILNLEDRHERQQTVDLRVLSKSHNEDIHFEAYDSVSIEDAIALTKIGCSPSRSISKSPPHRQDQAALVGNPPPTQHQQQYPPLDLATIQQLDVSTLAAIYDLVHVQLETALAAHQRTVGTNHQQQYVSPAPHQAATSTLSYQNSQTMYPHSVPSSSAPPINTRSYYHYPQYPPSPPQPWTATAKQVPISLSTEQLGNILSSVNNNSQ